MAIQLDHIFVPAKDKVKAATFIARILGVPYNGTTVFNAAPVHINEVLTLDFVGPGWKNGGCNHFAFLISEGEFDGILGRLQDGNVPFGHSGGNYTNGKINHSNNGRSLYFKCEDGHLWEVMTRPYPRS